MLVTIDRVEEDKIVVITESKNAFTMDKALCPEGIEGDIIEIKINQSETLKVKESVKKKFYTLKNKNRI